MRLLTRSKTHVKVVQQSDDVGPEPRSREHEHMLYPMYVIKIADFLTMRVAKPHQVLRAKGVAFEYALRDRTVSMFISHQWVGRRHPDPRFAQLQVLQDIIRVAAMGGLEVNMDIFSAMLYKLKPTVDRHHLRAMAMGYMWYDYFSVPQPEAAEPSERQAVIESLGKALASLSAYVDRCRFFVVLAPFIPHEDGSLMDYPSWKTRGWCRFERMARVLSQGDTSMLVASHSDSIYQVGAQDYLLDPVGCGVFTVEEDRAALAPKVERMLHMRLEYLAHAGEEREYQDLLAHRGILLDGLPPTSPPNALGQGSILIRPPSAAPAKARAQALIYATIRRDVGAMVRRPSAASGTERAQALFFATIRGDVGAMRSLLDSRVEVGCKEPRHNPSFLGIRGFTPAHYAVMHGHIGALQLLLERRADPNCKDARGNSTLFFVPDRSAREVVRLLADSRADFSVRGLGSIGLSPLETAVTRNRPEGLAALLAAGHPVQANIHGLNELHQCVVFGAGPHSARVLVEAGVSLCDRFRPRIGTPLWAMTQTWSMAHSLGKRGHRYLFAHHCLDATPLLFAVAGSQREIAHVLLECRADPEARNRRGLNSYDLARVFNVNFRLTDIS